MKAVAALTAEYTMVVLHKGPNFDTDEGKAPSWEHPRLYVSLRAAGLLSIVGPVVDETEFCGIAMFNAPLDQIERFLTDDPGVKAGVFTYEIHRCFSLVGDTVPPATSQPQSFASTEDNN